MKKNKNNDFWKFLIIAGSVFCISMLGFMFGGPSSGGNNAIRNPATVNESIVSQSQQDSRVKNQPLPEGTSKYNPIDEKGNWVAPKPISKFNQISQVDQARMGEIITGVMQNRIPITSDIKNELKGVFVKYNLTKEEIDDFASYGPALLLIYQGYFYIDALQAVSSGYPVKSSDRLNFEKEALSRGLMTDERIKSNDSEMDLIAKHQPVVSPNGEQIIFTGDNIRSIIKNINSISDRLVLLFK